MTKLRLTFFGLFRDLIMFTRVSISRSHMSQTTEINTEEKIVLMIHFLTDFLTDHLKVAASNPTQASLTHAGVSLSF